MAKRILFYLIGIGIGIIFVKVFFGNRKDIRFDWLPNDRTVKMLGKYPYQLEGLTASKLACLGLQRKDVDSIIQISDVDFSKSKIREVECKTYFLDASYQQSNYKLTMEVCDSIPTLQEIECLEKDC